MSNRTSQNHQPSVGSSEEDDHRRQLVEGARPPRPKRYPCPGCDRMFDRPSSLNLHMLSHTGEKPHACPRCSSRFASTSNLNRHMKTCGVVKWARPNEPSTFDPNLRAYEAYEEELGEGDNNSDAHMDPAQPSQHEANYVDEWVEHDQRRPEASSHALQHHVMPGPSHSSHAETQNFAVDRHEQITPDADIYSHRLRYPSTHGFPLAYQNHGEASLERQTVQQPRHRYVAMPNNAKTISLDPALHPRPPASLLERYPPALLPGSSHAPYYEYPISSEPVPPENDGPAADAAAYGVWYEENDGQPPAPPN